MTEDINLQIKKNNFNNIKWLDPLKEDVSFYGAPFIKENNNYARLPISEEKILKASSEKCYNLGQHSSGVQLHFVTNSSKLVIHAKVPNTSRLSGMTSVGQAGFDCYVGNNYDDLKFFDTTRFNPSDNEYEYTLFKNLTKEDKLVLINFPLYNKVDYLLIGIDDDAIVKKSMESFHENGTWIIYGTSITQGGCASRPGLTYTNILSRRFKTEFINMGFSGNAFGEYEYASLIANIKNISMFFINYEANGGTNGLLEKTLEKFISIIREKNEKAPIVVVSRIKYLFDDLNKETLGKNRERIRLFQENLVKKLRENDKHIYYVNGSKLLGEKYDEFTIDSIHPNDLGFMKIADSMEKEINKILIEDREV